MDSKIKSKFIEVKCRGLKPKPIISIFLTFDKNGFKDLKMI